ncbi:MAG: Na+/H+ antiporter NhaA [Vicinamibacterales bacterium]
MTQHLAPHNRVDVALVERTGGTTLALLVDYFLLLPIGVLVALAWANTAGESYFRFAHALRFSVNDIGMAFFVGMIAEEVLEAVMPGGALYRWRRTLLPFVAAIGGVLGATAAYLWYLQSIYEFMLLDGWPVAAALDVAFAYFVAKAIFPRRRGPVAFLLVLAIVSNAIGIVSIAIGFPAADGYPAALVLLAAAMLLAAWLRSARSDRIWLYLVTSGTLSWLACYWGGIPPALALVPIVPFLPHRPRGLDLFAEARPTAPRRFEHVFRYPVQVVLLFFGLVNGGVVLTGEMPGAWAVLTAALIGRPIGILVSVALAMAAGLRLPAHLRWPELIVVSLAASAGFTFALFFATSVMPPGPLLGELKLGALATAVGAVVALAAARLLHVGRFTTKPAGRIA